VQSRARNDVVVPEGSLESICGGSVERSAMTGPCLLPGRTDAACLLITDNADNAADGVQLGPEPEAFRRQTLDLTLVSIDLLLDLSGRYLPALDSASFGDRQFDELLDVTLPRPQLADPIRQGLEMSCARPGGEATARGMIIGAQRCDGRHEPTSEERQPTWRAKVL